MPVGIRGPRFETERLAAEAIALHLQGLAEDGQPIPAPDTIDIGPVESTPYRHSQPLNTVDDQEAATAHSTAISGQG